MGVELLNNFLEELNNIFEFMIPPKTEESKILEELGNRIKQIRLNKGISQTKLALNCDLEKSTLSKIESGKINITYLTLHKLIKCLDITAWPMEDDK